MAAAKKQAGSGWGSVPKPGKPGGKQRPNMGIMPVNPRKRTPGQTENPSGTKKPRPGQSEGPKYKPPYKRA